MEEEHGERKSWRLKMAGEGSDDWAPQEAEDMVPALDAEVQGDKKLEAGWQGQEDRGTSRKKTAGRRMSSRQRSAVSAWGLGPAGRSTRNGRRSSSA